jgi:hypothetical protein
VPAPVVPERYELTLPESGLLEASDLEPLAAMAKAKGLTNEQAQAAVNEYAQSLAAQSQTFRTALDAHPEVGGAQLAAAQTHALRALDRFLPATSAEGQQLRTALNKTGYGTYAPMVLLLARIGKAMGEDTAVIPNTSRQSAPDIVELFYGKQS